MLPEPEHTQAAQSAQSTQQTPLHPCRLQASCTFTQADFDRFADLSGDHNPIHVNPNHAARTAFGATVAHGMLLYSRLRGLIGQHFPACALQTQELMFPAPSYADEALTLIVDGTLDDGGARLLRMQVRKPDGRLGLMGAARMGVPGVGSGTGTGADAFALLPAPVATTLPRAPDTSCAPHASDRRAASGLPAFQALHVGDAAQVTRCYGHEDLEVWAALAQPSAIPAGVPEPLIVALFSYLLGEKVPGHGTNYLKQSMAFHAAARVGEPLTASVAITRLRPDKALVNLRTDCTGDGGRLLCSGQALVLFKC